MKHHDILTIQKIVVYDTLECHNVYYLFILIYVALPVAAIDAHINDVLTTLNVVFPAIIKLNADYVPTINGRTRYGSKPVKREMRYVLGCA